MPEPSETSTTTAVRTAAGASFALVATLVGGKPVRDALFLGRFGIEWLPAMVTGAALASILAAVAASRVLPRWGPARALPWALGASGGAFLVLWALLPVAPRTVAVLLYLHLGAGGSVLVSWFWSLVNERFDPHTAKRRIARIASGGTLGGVAGGLLAERLSAMPDLGTAAILPVLALLQVGTAVAIPRLGSSGGPSAAGGRPPGPGRPFRSGLRVLGEVPYLRALALIVVGVTLAATLLDFVFKAAAVEALGSERELVLLFGRYHLVVAGATLLVQAVASRPLLRTIGLGRTGALLPIATGIGGGGLLLAGSAALGPTLLVRGAESVLRSSVFRSSYELFYTPLPLEEKRAAKALIDVGCDKLGDVLGAGAVQVALVLGPIVAAGVPGAPVQGLLAGCVVASAVSLWVLLGLERGYRSTLARSLVEQALDLDPDDLVDGSSRTVYLQTIGLPRPAGSIPSPRTGAPTAEVEPRDPLEAADPDRIRARLGSGEPIPTRLLPAAIRLLGWDDVARDVIGVLREQCDEHVEGLVRALVDPDEEFVIRRRIPRVLSAGSTPGAVEGLVAGLGDDRFEVRYNCGAALARIRDRVEARIDDREAVLEAVRREAGVADRIRHGHRLLDRLDPDEDSALMTGLLADRTDATLAHVFTLLSLVMAPEPLRVAFHGLQLADETLRGTALEYLDVSLPGEVRSEVWPLITNQAPGTGPRRSADAVLAELLGSHTSIQLELDRQRKG